MRITTSTDPDDVLGQKLAALVRLKVAVSVTYLYEQGIRQHIRAALEAGATRAEVLEVIKLSTVIGIHAVAVGMPILDEESLSAGIPVEKVTPDIPTPVVDLLRGNGQLNPHWDAIYDATPDWLEGFLAAALPIWRDGILSPLWIELLCVAGDAAVTHLYSSGTRRHIHGALELGATRAQILAVLDIVGAQGQDALEVAIPILDELTHVDVPVGGSL